MEKCENNFSHWLNSQKWYNKNKIPWRRSLCLKGVPGTGKTSFVRYLGIKYGVPIISFDLSTFSNDGFSRVWSDYSKDYSPCIFLIEDIDGIFNKRENICKSNMQTSLLTFDCLLNEIDGIQNNDGLFIVITTNHIENLDKALLRPGRIDKVVEVGLMKEDQRRCLAKKICGFMDEERIEKVVSETDGMSAAQVNMTFVNIALEKHWESLA